MKLVIIRKDTVKDDIRKLFIFDKDFNGTNGKHFTSQIAKDSGHTSDLDYYIGRGVEKYDKPFDPVSIINSVLDGYYKCRKIQSRIDMKLLDTDCGLVVAINQIFL